VNNAADESIKSLAGSWEHCVCPPKHIRTMDNFLRPLFHDPRKLFGPYVRPGMTVMDVGCGGGFASMGLAQLVGEDGRVIAADLQPEMLAMVEKRVREAGLSGRVLTHRCEPDRVGVSEKLGFVVAFWLLHELPDLEAFLGEMKASLEPGGHMFVAEPRIIAPHADFEDVIGKAQAAGFTVADKPRVRFSTAAVFAA
jgi:2-polyprenyl-3-methyl-5-hydroxy-6-metoxy-1,4-benzoquinol methylase